MKTQIENIFDESDSRDGPPPSEHRGPTGFIYIVTLFSCSLQKPL